MLEGDRRYTRNGLEMGVKNWGDAEKSGKNTHLIVIMRVKLSQKIGMHNLTIWTRFKKVKWLEKHKKSIHDYCEIHLMLHTHTLLLCARKSLTPDGVIPSAHGTAVFHVFTTGTYRKTRSYY